MAAMFMMASHRKYIASVVPLKQMFMATSRLNECETRLTFKNRERAFGDDTKNCRPVLTGVESVCQAGVLEETHGRLSCSPSRVAACTSTPSAGASDDHYFATRITVLSHVSRVSDALVRLKRLRLTVEAEGAQI